MQRHRKLIALFLAILATATFSSCRKETIVPSEFVYAKEGRLYFANGEELSLWGVNLQPCLSWEYNSLFKLVGLPETAEILKQATDDALELPWTPSFLHKTHGWVMALGQFTQWVASHLLATGTVQIWPGTPVEKVLIDQQRVVGVQLLDQGVDAEGRPADGFLPGMQVRAALTVVGDGPVGAVSQHSLL